ncbi:MAG: glycosyl hydrolase family 18 protein [Candidatus Stygibacter australis]|nr:glycosyl hydrolase family 18 protein [Candidatus Stygibacter australis]MDP8322629.1 glycosyl hydrolase family 18 protein [Candidatus Stygibacter australis]
MNKIIIVVFLLCIMFLSGQPLPEKVMVGYWHNWGYSPNSILLSEITDAFDVINIAFATPTEPYGSTMQFTPDAGIYPSVDDFIADIGWLHDQGKKVVISIGGANDPVSLLTAGEVNDFVNSMSSIITTYGFDGIDIDLEGGSVSLDVGDNDFRFPTTAKIVNMIDALTQLTDQMPSLLLTTAPETAYVQGGYGTYAGIWGAYLPIIHALRDRWDIVQVQHYNTGSMYGLDGNLYDPATADFHVAMAEMLMAGFNVDVGGSNIFFEPLLPCQVAIGLPASPNAAGTGYTTPLVVQEALDYLIMGYSFGGTYQLANPDGYYGFRGLMTWSINWDADNNFEFSSSHRLYLDNFINPGVIPPENITAVVNGYDVMINWDPSPYDFVDYFVYRNWAHIVTTSDTTYIDYGLFVGTYSYGVSAITDEGASEIVWADDVVIEVIIDPPFNLQVDPFTGIFSWELYSDVTGFNVYLDENVVGYTTARNWLFEDLVNGQEYLGGVQAVYEDNTSEIVDIIFTYMETGISEEVLTARIMGNYPNPFNPSTTITYFLPVQQKIDISIYNVRGEKVIRLANGVQKAGSHTALWNGEDEKGNGCSSGVFYIRLKTETLSNNKKILLLK